MVGAVIGVRSARSKHDPSPVLGEEKMFLLIPPVKKCKTFRLDNRSYRYIIARGFLRLALHLLTCRWGLLIPAVLAFAAVCLAQSFVEGTVHDLNGQPIATAIVKLERAQGSVGQQTITDSDENFDLAE